MRRAGNPDHLSSSLTDLMTSLMVIFILLLLVFMDRQASAAQTKTDQLLGALQKTFSTKEFQQIRRDGPNSIVLIAPKELQFQSGQSALEPKGTAFLQGNMPKLAGIVCSPRFKPFIDSVVVEGHTDLNWEGAKTQQEEKEKNLKLSQDRSMQVVEDGIQTLRTEDERGCFLNTLSATGRGDQGCSQREQAYECRHVLFRIHISPERVAAFQEAQKK